MIYAFGQFELDTRIYELRDAGTVRPVEPQVFDVLAYLIEHRDRVISKEELLEKLWPGRFVSETTLTSRLKEARKAVRDTGKTQAIIRTHHGRGYRFIAEVEELDGAMTAVSGDFFVRATPVVEERPGFVGRTSELAALERARALAMAGQRQLVFVAGEAGAGKTTLVEAFLREAKGLTIARGQCVEHRGSGEPYMPLLDALARLCREDGRAIEMLSRDAPSWLLQMPWLLSDRDLEALRARTPSGDRMLRELAMFVERYSCDTPLVIAIEDLHWSDYATLEALDLLARHTHPARLLIVGTFRPADVKAARHPVYAIVQELRARGLCEMLALPLLVTRELEAFLRMRFAHADFTGDLAAILHARTSGNPLFVGNLVEAWVAHGLIREHDGQWTLETPLAALETGVPDSLQQLLDRQIGELDAEQQRMLETASAIGREFSIAALAATMSADDDALELRCESFAREGRFVRAAGTEQWGDGTFTSRFAFTHDLFVEVLYARIPEARRARLHQQAGLALERAWQGRELERGAEMALHFQRAHDRERAMRYLDLAAQQAFTRNAFREAVLHLSAMLELVDGDPRELDVRARLAPALIATRGYADPIAEKNYLRATELARKSGDAAMLSQLLYGMGVMYEYRGEYRRAEEIANERVALDPCASSVLESHELLACSMLHQGRFREAVEHAQVAFDAAQRCGDVRDRILLLVQTHGWLSGALVFMGRGAEAIGHNDEAIRIGNETGDDRAKATALIQAAFIRFYRREVDPCDVLAAEGSAIARERRFPFHLACGRILAGWCLALRGAHEEGIREIRAGLRTSISIGARLDVPLFMAMLAEALEAAGERQRALDTLDEALALVNHYRAFFYLPEIYRMMARLIAERDPATARDTLQRALAMAEAQETPLLAERVRETLARL